MRRVGAQRPALARHAGTGGDDAFRCAMPFSTQFTMGVNHVEAVGACARRHCNGPCRAPGTAGSSPSRGAGALSAGESLVVLHGIDGGEPRRRSGRGRKSACPRGRWRLPRLVQALVSPAMLRPSWASAASSSTFIVVPVAGPSGIGGPTSTPGSPPRVLVMPVSHRIPGIDLPAIGGLRGPDITLFTAATCAALRQVPVFLPLQASTAGSNLQLGAANTSPSFAPSSASQAPSMASLTSLRSSVAEGGACLRLALRVLRCDGIQCGRAPAQAEVGVAGAHRRRASDDAVEVGGIALRHDHRLAATSGAAHEVRTVRRLAVVLRDDLLRRPP